MQSGYLKATLGSRLQKARLPGNTVAPTNPLSPKRWQLATGSNTPRKMQGTFLGISLGFFLTGLILLLSFHLPRANSGKILRALVFSGGPCA